jgi:hypothetical protein
MPHHVGRAGAIKRSIECNLHVVEPFPGSQLRFASLSGLRPALFVFDAFGVGSLEFVQSLCPMLPTESCP